jgi:hypothetical protein
MARGLWKRGATPSGAATRKSSKSTSVSPGPFRILKISALSIGQVVLLKLKVVSPPLFVWV